MVWRIALCLFTLAEVLSCVGMAHAQPSRQYAPGVLTVIPPLAEYEDTYTGPVELVEVAKGLPELDWDPHYLAKSQTVFEKSKMVTMRRDIWCFEFAFKPMRSIYVDVPQASGKLQRKLIWYLVYRVRYLGSDLRPTATTDQWGRVTYEQSTVDREDRYFFPQFLLECHDLRKTYQDRVIPAAREPIQAREVQGTRLLNSVEISRQPIPLTTPDNPQEAWGLATWEDIDPRIDFLSVFVRGLTNAYKPVDLPEGFEPGAAPGTGRQLLAKTLRLNFWRPGDAIEEDKDHVYYGVPYSPDPQRQLEILSAFGLNERLDHSWVYR